MSNLVPPPVNPTAPPPTPLIQPQPNERNLNENRGVPLTIIQKELITFDGNKNNLSRFLRVSESALNLVSPQERETLFEIIKLKLADKAYQLTKNRLFDNWDHLKTYLEEVFSEKRSQGQWEIELHSCRQQKTESVIDFATRVENILNKLIDSVTLGENFEASNHYERLLRKQATNVFISGLKDPLSLLIKARNPENFERAVEIAIAEEREIANKYFFRNNTFSNPQQKFNPRPQNNVSCKICHKTNHTTEKCFKNRNNNVLTISEAEKFCNYCKKNGHLISECRTRQRNNERKNSLGTSNPLNARNTSATGDQKPLVNLKAERQ